MNNLYLITFTCILTLSGCFNSPSNSEKDPDLDQSLKMLWEYAYDPDGGSPIVYPRVHKDQFVLSSGDNKITALRLQDGSELWKTPLNHNTSLRNRKFGISDNVIMGSVRRRIIAWDIISGIELWNTEIDSSLTWLLYTGLTSVNNLFYTYGSNGELYILTEDGNLNFTNYDERIYDSAVDGSNLILSQARFDAAVVSSINLETLQVNWKFELIGFGYPAYAPPIIENGIVYVGTVGGPGDSRNGFFALNASTGQEIWRREGIFTYAAILADDRIYGVNGNNVWALNKSTGQMVWSTNSQGGGHGEGTLAWLDGHVYWSHSSGLHVFKGDTGELVHVEPAPDRTYFWLVTADKGRIFAQTSRHLYAFAPWGHEEALE